MPDFEVYSTDWDQIPEETRENLIVTGRTGFEYVFSGRNLSARGGIVAYLNKPIDEEYDSFDNYLRDLDLCIPEDSSQELYVVETEDKPSSFPFRDAVIAEIDVLAEDYLRSDPRRFSTKVKRDERFRKHLRKHLSTTKKYELMDKIGIDSIEEHLDDIL